MSSKALYLVNPVSDFPTYFGGEAYAAWGFEPATIIADLTLPTLAALAPDDFHVRLCDEVLTPVDYDTSADYVAITGKVTQQGRMRAIAREFRQRGKVVLIGGPYASLCPEVLRPHCDILVRGELEGDAAEALFVDFRRACWKDEYVGGKPDLATSPLPRWDLYPNSRALMATIQTSRGCPFECEFCDVIQYLGRRQRHKTPGQVVRELDEVYRHGYRQVFLADDNFTVARSRTKELLRVMRAWNLARQQGRVSFITQLSIDAARDEELLRLCAEAGLTQVFIGIETPNSDSLRESKKHQNLGIDLVEQVQRFLDQGISVLAGMIIGFDSDGPDIFERQYHFAMSVPIPIFTIGALVAPAATPLHTRLQLAGRLIEEGPEVAALPWNTNIQPRQMTREQLLEGMRVLCQRLYAPSAFEQRILNFIHRFGPRRDPLRGQARRHPEELRSVEIDSMNFVGNVPRLGDQERRMFAAILSALRQKPEAAELVLQFLGHYLQIRHLYQYGNLWPHEPRGRSPDSKPAVPTADKQPATPR